jgi:hypothetical protein
MKIEIFDNIPYYTKDCSKHSGYNTVLIPVQKYNTFTYSSITNSYSEPTIEAHDMCKICYVDHLIEKSLEESDYYNSSRVQVIQDLIQQGMITVSNARGLLGSK